MDAKRHLAAAVHKVLSITALSVRAQLHRLVKADEITLDLSELEGLDEATRAVLAEIAGDSGQLILGQIGVDDTTLFGQVDARAVQWAADHAAALVTQITDATYIKLQNAITLAMAEGAAKDEMIADIMDAGAFSEERATFIADTEVGFANSQGSLMGMQEAQNAGVNLQKEWDATDEPCPICQENQEAGPIDLDQVFPSGDDAPLAHPRCRCVLVGVTSE